MHIVFSKKDPDQVEFGLIYGGIALLALCTAGLFPVLSFFPSCTFRGLFSIPCPACGSTRSMVHLAHGDISAAVAMNPLTALCFIAASLLFFYSLIVFVFDLPRIRIRLSAREGTVLRVTAVCLVLVQWIYLTFSL